MTIESLIILLEFLTAIAALTHIKKYKSKQYLCFLIYVWLIFLIEFTAMILKEHGMSNSWLYNFYTLFEINLVALFYFFLLKNFTRYLKGVVLLFNAVYFLSFVFLELNKYTLILGSFAISIAMILYLREFLRSDKIVNYKKNLSFWITVGLLLYYLGTIPFQTMLNIYGLQDRMLFYIPIFLTLFTHSLFIYGILCSNKEMSL